MNRVVRSTRVPIALRLPAPQIRPPSQWPGTALSVISGRSLIMTVAALRLLSGWDGDTAHELTRTATGCAACSCTCTPRSNARWPATASRATPPLGLLEHYKGPDGLRRAGATRIREYARRHGLKGTAITDAIGEQTVTVPGTRAAVYFVKLICTVGTLSLIHI